MPDITILYSTEVKYKTYRCYGDTAIKSEECLQVEEKTQQNDILKRLEFYNEKLFTDQLSAPSVYQQQL